MKPPESRHCIACITLYNMTLNGLSPPLTTDTAVERTDVIPNLKLRSLLQLSTWSAMRWDWVAQCLSQSDLESLQVWRLHSLCGQPLPLFDSSHNEKDFPYIQSKLILFQIMSITTVSCKSIPHSTCLLTSAQRQNILFQTEWNLHAIGLHSVFSPGWSLLSFSFQDARLL